MAAGTKAAKKSGRKAPPKKSGPAISPATRAKAAQAKAATSGKANGQPAEDQAAIVARVLKRAKLDPAKETLTPEQTTRAVEADKKAGLTGKALATFVIDGQDLKAQQADAQTGRAAVKAADRTRANVTKTSDPDATELAADAREIALKAGLKSAYLPLDARAALDLIGKKNALEVTGLKEKDLKAFAEKNETTPEVRKAISALGKGTRLYGRKLAIFMYAAHKRAK